MMNSGHFHSSALYCSLMLNTSDYKTPSPNSSLPWFFAFCPSTVSTGLHLLQWQHVLCQNPTLHVLLLSTLPKKSPQHVCDHVTFPDYQHLPQLFIFSHCSSLLLFSYSILKGSIRYLHWSLPSVCLETADFERIKAIFLLCRTKR